MTARVALRFAGLVAALLIAAPNASVWAQQRNGRILGVFDDATYQPIAGAEVVDLGTGTKAITTVTGTISLANLRPGTTVLQVRKLGYASKMLPVAVSATDTASITVVLTSTIPSLPTVVTKARQPGDTVRKLELTGYYDRQRSTGAPASSFVTAEDLARWNLSLLSDLKFHTPRGICGELYIDGTYIPSPSMARGSRYKQGADELLRPEQIAGIEVYTGATVPAQYNKTRVAPDRCAVTLIWLK